MGDGSGIGDLGSRDPGHPYTQSNMKNGTSDAGPDPRVRAFVAAGFSLCTDDSLGRILLWNIRYDQQHNLTLRWIGRLL